MEDSDDSADVPSETDFYCSCCYDLLVDPTTLNCGHNFCQFCLAQWWYSSRKTTCPECRQSWQGFPSINFLLRRTIKKLFPDELSERQERVKGADNYNKVLQKFENFGKRRRNHSQRNTSVAQQDNPWVVITKSIAIVAGVIGILMLLYDFLGMKFSSSEPLVSKPVTLWTAADVSKWVASLGPWASGEYDKRFLAAGINGMVLVTLTEADLEEPLLGMKVAVHRRVLMQALDDVKNLGVKPPMDLWEYKAAHHARCMFLVWGFREFPRPTAIYIFFALHDELFMPLLYHTSEHNEEDIILDPYEPWHAPKMEYLRFMVRVLLMPYYLVGKFAFKWIDVNSWTVCIILMYCLLMTASELLQTRWLLLGGWKELPSLVWNNITPLLFNGLLHLVIWHVIPTLIADMHFYWMLYLSPIYGWSLLKTSWYQMEREDVRPVLLAEAAFLWVWRKVTARLGV